MDVDCSRARAVSEQRPMTAGTPPGRPAIQRTRAGAARQRKLAVLTPLAALGLAAVAIGGTYLTSGQSTRSRSKSAISAASAQANATATAPTMRGAFPVEHSPAGTEGRWIGDVASVKLVGLKRSWLAFRALSLRRSRTLMFAASHGAHIAVRIGARPGLYVVGPFPEGAVSLHPTPGSAVASPRDRRRLSVFLSTLRAFPSPVAALPGSGFWDVELVHGLVFNWLRGTGAVDVYSPRTQTGHIWLTFIGRSVGEKRTLIASSGRMTSQALVTTSPHLISLGPFRLVGGRVRVLLRASPGPRRYGADPRLISVEVAQLAAHTSATGM